VSKNRSRPYVVDELELTPTFDKEPFFICLAIPSSDQMRLFMQPHLFMLY
jgi:hypothetical protein